MNKQSLLTAVAISVLLLVTYRCYAQDDITLVAYIAAVEANIKGEPPYKITGDDAATVNQVFSAKDPAIVFDGKKLHWVHRPKAFRRYRKQRIVALFPSTFACTLTRTPLSYSPSSPLSPPGVGAVAGPVTMLTYPLVFTPTADDEQIDVAFFPIIAGNPSKVPADTDTKLIPVEVRLFDPPTVAFSLGVIASNLHDENYVLVPTGSGSIIAKGLDAGGAIKGIAMTHLVLVKTGDFLIGPSLGVMSNGGYFLGGSALFGKSSRFALSLGWEWSKVSRLNTVVYTPSQSVPNGTSINQTVFKQSSLEVAFTYSFITIK